jgi:hypothetical protein
MFIASDGIGGALYVTDMDVLLSETALTTLNPPGVGEFVGVVAGVLVGVFVAVFVGVKVGVLV